MNCDQVRDHLLAGGARDAPELVEHRETCNGCRELVSAQGLVRALRGAPAPGDLSALRLRVQADLEAETGLVASLRSLPTKSRWALALGLGLSLVALEGLCVARADLALVPAAHLAASLSALSTLVGIGVWMALRPLQQSALGGRAQFLWVLACLAVLLSLSVSQPVTGHPAALKGSGAELLPYAGLCLGHGLLLCAIVWLGFRGLDRQGLRTRHGALLAGMTGALVATAALQLHCAIPTASHWLLGHVGVGVVVLLLSLSVGTLRKRAR